MPSPEEIAKLVESLDYWGAPNRRLQNNRAPIKGDMRDAASLIRSLQERVRVLEEAITPSGDTKAAYMGEFSFAIVQVDESGDEHTVKIPVPWTTIKEIMAAIKARSTLSDSEGG